LPFALALALGCSGTKLEAPVNDAGTVEPDTGLPPPPVDSGVPGATTAVSIIVEPSDNAAAIVAAIQGAKKSVHMTMYLLSSQPVIDALIARKKQGVDVKVVLNKTFPAPGSDNNAEYQTLLANGVGVVWASSTYQYTHSKSVVIDGASVWIMTMNLTTSSPTQNREFLAVDTDSDDVAEAEAIFQADYAQQKPSVTGKLLVSPINSHSRMLELLGGATKSIDLEGESLSDTQIVGALVAAKQKGLAVRVVVSDQTPSPAMATAIANLKNAKVPIVKLGTPYIHSKAFVVDGVQAYVGSENFTMNSLDYNRELGMVVAAPAEVAKVAQTIDADFKKGTAL
jgi:phosphatidylserine/phosphatidylglycerophosphate/cardiolipin synthase-like enzyme